MFTLAPSLLASDFSNLENEIKRVYMDGKGCNYLHLDVMDGVFVKNISFGLPVISSIRKVCDIIFDVHLMITKPIRYIHDFIEAGADMISFHYEACDNIEEVLKTIDLIKNNNIKCSVAIKPDTPVDVLLPFIDKLDMVLIMSVEPGFGGQKFIDKCMNKIKELNKIKSENNYDFIIEVDGGINFDNAKEIKDSGADIIVVGTGVFKSENVKETIERYMNV
ncbi:MAG: ribulose-phosphate 3-epimerase [Oscillospiraceae bacterium]|nr:ribulose-phosphate 3-epimerase [Oscillospiraceae bacterium]